MGLNRTAHALIWPLLALMFAGFVVETGGLAALQQRCWHHPLYPYSYVELPYSLSCGKVYRWLWWIWAFEFFVFAGLVLCAAMNILDRGIGLGWLALLACVTTLQMWGGNTALDLLDAYSGNGSAAGHPGTGVDRARAKTLFAGYVITGVANGLMLLALGTALAMTNDDDNGGGVIGRRRNKGDAACPPGTAPATATGSPV